MTSRKNLVQTAKWSTSTKTPDSQNGGKSSGAHFHMWGQNSNAYSLYMVEKEIYQD